MVNFKDLGINLVLYPRSQLLRTFWNVLMTGPIISTIISLLMCYISKTQNVSTKSAIVNYIIHFLSMM